MDEVRPRNIIWQDWKYKAYVDFTWYSQNKRNGQGQIAADIWENYIDFTWYSQNKWNGQVQIAADIWENIVLKL